MNNRGNKKISLDQLLFTTLYYRYNIFFVPVSVILVCLLLFWFIIIPQMQAFFAMKDTLVSDTQNLSVLHQNLTTITNLDSAKLNQTLTTATNALPAEKDFAGILSALNGAAVGSGVVLQDYSFQLGDLSGLDQNGKVSQLPTQLTVTIAGDAYAADRFMKQLKAQLPLADVSSLTANADNSVSLSVLFFYAPIPKITFNDSVVLPVLTAQDGKLLDSLGLPVSSDFGTVASHSALPTGTPTITPSPTPSPAVSLTPSPSVATQSAK